MLYILFSIVTDTNIVLPWYVSEFMSKRLHAHTFYLFKKLLEFRVKRDSDDFYHTLSLNVPMKQLEPVVHMHCGHSRFILQNLIFDVETRKFYEFPPFGQTLVRTRPHRRVSSAHRTTGQFIFRLHLEI